MRTLYSLLLSALALTASAADKDTVKIYFNTGVTTISNNARSLLDSVVYHEVLAHGKAISIIGYADYVGADSLNDRLSLARARSVADYLHTLGFNEKDMVLVAGKGEVNRRVNGKGYTTDRRVDIVHGRIANAAQHAATPNPLPAVAPVPKIDIAAVKPNSTFRLEGIHFMPGSPVLLEGSQPVMEELLKAMKDNLQLKISIEGHVCCIKADPFKDSYTSLERSELEGANELSRSRAKTVYTYLLSNGIDATRMKYTGYGYERPLVTPEKTEADAIRNRRVEIRILQK